MNEAVVVLVRSLIAFFTLLVFARILGKQQITQLTFFDYVLGITIGSIAATLSVDLSSRAWPHWIALLTWTLVALFIQWLTFRSATADTLLCGEPTIVIRNGQVMEDTMKKLRYTTSDLLQQLRDKDAFDLNQVAFAVLETNGELSVMLKPEYQPATPGDLKLPLSSSGLSLQLIYNGEIVDENLRRAGWDRVRLLDQLKQQGINNESEVFMASYRPDSGTLYVDKKEDYL